MGLVQTAMFQDKRNKELSGMQHERNLYEFETCVGRTDLVRTPQIDDCAGRAASWVLVIDAAADDEYEMLTPTCSRMRSNKR